MGETTQWLVILISLFYGAEKVYNVDQSDDEITVLYGKLQELADNVTSTQVNITCILLLNTRRYLDYICMQATLPIHMQKDAMHGNNRLLQYSLGVFKVIMLYLAMSCADMSAYCQNMGK